MAMSHPCASATPGRLVHKVDFERLLATRAKGRSAHFAVHHLPQVPAAWVSRLAKEPATKISTDSDPALARRVDNSASSGLGTLVSAPSVQQHWLGCVVPKRQARRAVTRSLLKRQMRECFRQQAPHLASGLWLLRLHAGFDRQQHASAASGALALGARCELQQLLGRP